MQGPFGFDTNYVPAMSYVSGTAAAALDLAQGSGALTPSPGGLRESVAKMMDNITTMFDQNGNPVEFGSYLSNDSRLDTNLAAWGDTMAGDAYEYLASNTAAASDMPVMDPPGTHSGPGASKPIWGASAEVHAWISVGHGPGSA